MDTMSNDFDDILTVKEAAKYLKLAQSSVYKLAKEDRLPARKVGGSWRFSRRGLDEWIANPDWMNNPAASEE